MRDRRGIRSDRAAGGSIRGIARATGASRNAVRRALHPGAALDYSRPSVAEEFAPAVRDVLADYPRLTVNQISEIVDWPASRRALSNLVAQLRPLALERELDALTEISPAPIQIGSISVGVATVGAVTVRSIDGLSQAFLPALRPAWTSRRGNRPGLA